MKWTPQNTIVSCSLSAAFRDRSEGITNEVGDVLDLGQLVVVGEDHGSAGLRKVADLLLQGLDLGLCQVALLTPCLGHRQNCTCRRRLGHWSSEGRWI